MNIYFSGIGGVGIGPLAEIANDAGYQVVGSDLEESLMTKELRTKGIKVNIGQDGIFLQNSHQNNPIDWFIYTSALPEDHAELGLAKKLGIRIAKRDELLAYIIKDKNLKLIGIAGTHGKTTTTAMMVWTMKQLNIPISYSIGTTVKFGPSGKFDPKSEYFIYECDEFDRNFLHFSPYLSLITSIDYDHPEVYPTKQDYLEAFRQFAVASNNIVAWSDQHSEIFNGMPQVKFLQPSDINSDLTVTGEAYRRDATLAQTGLKQLGIDQNTNEIINQYPGTGRRFEKLADNLYSDYGHHPVEIAATLQLAHEISDRIMLVYQPHQNIRQHQIISQYTDQFELAESIYWLPTYLTREDPKLRILTPADLIENISNKNDVIIADFNDELWNNIQIARKEGMLVLCMGAGKIDSWVREKLSN